MENLIAEILEHAALRGIKPATVLQRGGGLSGTVWDKWVAGTAACTLPMAERLRGYMAQERAKLNSATSEKDVA
jgi:hypothetical protein